MSNDANKNQEEGSSSSVGGILYVGHDLSYLDELKLKYREYFPHTPRTFYHLQELDKNRIQGLYLEVLECNPKIVIIDLSLHGEEYLQLARLILRINATRTLPVIAIFDDLASKLIPASVVSGVKFNFHKTSDFYVLSRAMTYSLSPHELDEAQLANATLNDKVEAYECCQVGFITEETIHLELSKELKKDQTINIRTILQQEKLFTSLQMDLVETSQRSLFYNYDYNAQLSFRFADKIIPEDHPQGDLPELELERSNEIQAAKLRLKKWIEKNQNAVQEKFLRTLIIERDLSFLAQDERTDSYDFLIRLHPYSLDSKKEIQRLLPHLIVFQFDIFDEDDDKPLYTNEPATLKKMIEAVKTFSDYQPYIVVFNSHLSSTKLQEEYSYTNIVAYDKPLEVDIIINLVQVLKEKMKDNFDKIADLNPLFIKKDRKGSLAEIRFQVKIIKLSEAEIMFETDYALEKGQVIHFDMPTDMFVTISHETFERPEIKKGFISGANELGLATLRRYINGVFFRDKQAQKEEEAEAFRKLNEEAKRKREREAAEAEEAKNNPEEGEDSSEDKSEEKE